MQQVVVFFGEFDQEGLDGIGGLSGVSFDIYFSVLYAIGSAEFAHLVHAASIVESLIVIQADLERCVGLFFAVDLVVVSQQQTVLLVEATPVLLVLFEQILCYVETALFVQIY